MIKKMSIKAKLLFGFILIASFTVISSLLGLLFNYMVGNEGEHIGAVLAPESYAVMEVTSEVLKAHLILEEVLAGETQESFSDVSKHFDRSQWYCNAIINGGTDSEVSIIPTDDMAIRQLVGELEKDIEELSKVSKHRNALAEERKNNATVLDAKFDDIFESLEDDLTYYVNSRQFSSNIIQQASKAKFLLAHGHLLLQEFEGGDVSVEQQEIVSNFEEAYKMGGILNGNQGVNADEIVKRLKKLYELAEKRIEVFARLNKSFADADVEFDEIYESFNEKAHEVEEIIVKNIKLGLEHQQEINNSASAWMIIISILSFVLALSIAFIIVNNITKPIYRVVEFADEVAKGNLNAKLDIKQEDEIGKLIDAISNMVAAFKQGVAVLAYVAEGRLGKAQKAIDNDMEGDFNDALINLTEKLALSASLANSVADGNLSVDVSKLDDQNELDSAVKKMIINLKEIITNIRAGAENITIASQQMSGASTDLSQSATEQAASVEEISSSMEEMSANNQQNTDNAKETEQISTKAANSIVSVGDASRKSLDSVKNIAEKISVINDIAFQTNILALNAAVEAARAGEHGKGFAVVASEVRKLAVKSKDAAEEIVSLARTSVQHTEEASRMTEDLHPEIQKTSMLVQEISASSEEQNSGYNQINNAIQQLNSVTQQNAASAEEMATSSEELSSQAEQLKSVIKYFRTDSSLIEQTSKSMSRTAKGKHLLNQDSKAGVDLNIDENKPDFESY